MKNWKTTLIGFVAGLPQIVTCVLAGDYKGALLGAGVLLIGLLAKDAGVTGVGL